MTAFFGNPALDPIVAAIAAGNPHDGVARAEAMNPFRSVICLAPAGSGKTSELILRLLACLSISTKPEEVLAITFTTLAAGEIKERLLAALSLAQSGVTPEKEHEKPLFELARLVLRRDQELGWNLLVNPSRLRIMTFDSFSAYLAGKTPIMSGLGGGQTSDDPHLIYRQAILETLAAVNDPSAPEVLREALEQVLTLAKNQFEKLVPMFANLLAKRDQWAGEIVGLDVADMELALGHMLDVEKQEAINVLQNGDIDALVNVLADAATALPGFEWALNVPPVQSRSEYADFLREFAGFALKADGDLRAMVNVKNGFPAGHPLTKRCNDVLKDLKGTEQAERYASALNTLVKLPDAEFPDFTARMVGHFAVILRYLLANLTLAFEETASLDFPEVAVRAIQALGSDTDIGEALLDEDRINHILVDEVQDSSPNQYQLLLRITSEWSTGDGRTLFMCGDLSQSIYLFRNATPEIFKQIVKTLTFGNLQLELHRLVVNFRSSPAVVQWNNECYEHVFGKSDVPFVASVPAHATDGSFSVRPISTGPIGEARSVCDQLEELIATDPLSSVAILVRSRSNLKHILVEMKARGIKASGQNIDPITESAPVSEVVSLVRSLWHLADRTSWFSMLRASFVGLSWGDCITIAQGGKIVLESMRSEAVQQQLTQDGYTRIKSFLKAYDDVHASSRAQDLAWASKALWVSLGGPATVDQTEIEDVLTVFSLLLQHTVTGCLEQPQAFFRAVSKLYATPKPGRVLLMTVHAAKGLEYDHVICPGLNARSTADDQPLFHWRRINNRFVLTANPGSEADPTAPETRLFKFMGSKVKNDTREEVARLAYVMTTRAKKTCTLYGCINKLDDETSGSYASGSLLESLWPAVSDAFDACPAGAVITTEEEEAVPSKARLTAGFKPELPVGIFIPASSNDQAPTENDLSDEDEEAQGKDLCRRLEGIVFHKVIEIIGGTGVESWDAQRIGGKGKAISSMLAREGYPAASIQAGVARVIDLAISTISCPHGRWVLKPRENSGQEVQVSSYRAGRWVHRILDRSFVEDDVYWIVDWKSSAPNEGEDIDAFIARETSRYKAKMNEYRQVVQDAGITIDVQPALYFPEIQRLVHVD